MGLRSVSVLALVLCIFTCFAALTRFASAEGLLHVQIFPNATAKTKTHPTLAPDSDLAAEINSVKRGLYDARIVDTCPNPFLPPCKTQDASIFVRIASEKTGSYDFVAFDAQDGSVIGTLQGRTADANGRFAFSAADLTILLGTPQIVGNSLVVSHGYHQYIELVPDLQSPSDPDYAFALSYALRERGVTAIRSQYNTVTLAGASDNAICSNGDRYLVYSVSIDTNSQTPFSLFGTTQLRAQSSGFLLDCTVRTTRGFAAQSKKLVPTTTTTLSGINAILIGLYSKFGTRFALTTTAFSSFINVDPTSVTQRNSVAEKSLNGLVESFCSAVPLSAPTPVVQAKSSAPPSPPTPPNPSPGIKDHGPHPSGHATPPGASPPSPVPSASPVAPIPPGGPQAGANSTNATTGTASTVPFNPSALTASFVYPLRCSSPPPNTANKQHSSSALQTLRNRWISSTPSQ